MGALAALVVALMPDDAREPLAAAVHGVWSEWMTYLLGQCWHYPTGGVVIPAELVARWQRQLRTPYAALPEAERESARQIADELIRVFNRG